MATATLELVNPYSKYGFKRRPTYNEIIGLINENETITGQVPDRTATLYKASPEGSFFDGTDNWWRSNKTEYHKDNYKNYY